MEELITALLAPVAGGRRFWTRAPAKQGDALLAKPYLVLNVIDDNPNYHFKGPSGYSPIRVQIDCYADTYTSALATSRSVQSILSGYSGGDIQAIFVEGVRDLPAADAGDVTNLFRKSIDIIVHYGDQP